MQDVNSAYIFKTQCEKNNQILKDTLCKIEELHSQYYINDDNLDDNEFEGTSDAKEEPESPTKVCKRKSKRKLKTKQKCIKAVDGENNCDNTGKLQNISVYSVK